MAGLCVPCQTQGFAHDSQLSHKTKEVSVCVCIEALVPV